MADHWSELSEEGWRIWGGLHRLLFRLAGQMPDDWIAYTREMLATGDLAYLPDTISGSVLELGVPLTRAEVEFLPTVLPAFDQGDEPPVGLEQVRVSAGTPPTGHRFCPVPPQVLAAAGERIPARLDLTGGESDARWDLPPDLARLTDLAYELTDSADGTVTTVLSMRAEVIGVWRAWRFGPDGPPEDGRRVYLVEVEPSAKAWKVAYNVQFHLTRKEEHPQVEVYWSREELTPYHQAARANSALLWAREPGRARVTPIPEEFAPDHPRVTNPLERDLLVSRLSAGSVISTTQEQTTDVVEPARGAVVPSTYRTDGHWVWPEATTYYLAEYRLAPPQELVEHLHTTTPPFSIDGVRRFRAENALLPQNQ